MRLSGRSGAPTLEGVTGRLAIYLVVLLVLLNAGGLLSLILDLGRGQFGPALGKLLVMSVLDVVGVGLLRQLRDEG